MNSSKKSIGGPVVCQSERNQTSKSLVVFNFIRKALLYCLIPVVFMPYTPSILISRGETMNLELTLPIVWLVLFFAASIPFFIYDFKQIFLNKITLLSLLFPFYTTLSLIWTSNLLRGILTCGLLWLLYFAILSIVHYFNILQKTQQVVFKKQLLKSFFITSLVIGAICWLQCILDVLSVPYSITQLCAVCTNSIFGFPHPNGFAIEPQYMGNLLLAPTLLALYFFNSKSTNKQQTLQYGLLFIAFMITLCLTLSRGAIFSFGVAFLVFLITVLVKKRSILSVAKNILVAFVAFLISVLMQGAFTEIAPTSSNFYTGISTYVSQLSLGTIELKELFNNDNNTQILESDLSNDGEVVAEQNDVAFDGYIEASTDVRVLLSSFALEVWSHNPPIFLFGVGYGGAGTSLFQFYNANLFSEEILAQYANYGLFLTPKEIVQNEYVEILLEFGIIGFTLALLDLLIIIKIFSRRPARVFFYLLFIAYGTSFFFLSGFTNVFHIYLLTPLLYFAINEKN